MGQVTRMATYEIVSKLTQILQNLPGGVQVVEMQGDFEWRIVFTVPRDLTSTEIDKIQSLFPWTKVNKTG